MPDLAWPEVAVLQDKYSVSFAFTLIEPLSPMMLAILGDPLAVLWWQMGKLYRSHWYLGDGESC
jgi:hypothetical protein